MYRDNYVKRGDIYYAYIGAGYGHEQYGARPVLIIQNDMGNRYSPTVIVAIITSAKKKDLPTHVCVYNDCLDEKSCIVLEQIRTVDKRRLKRYLGTVDNETMKKVDDAVRTSLAV